MEVEAAVAAVARTAARAARNPADTAVAAEVLPAGTTEATAAREGRWKRASQCSGAPSPEALCAARLS